MGAGSSKERNRLAAQMFVNANPGTFREVSAPAKVVANPLARSAKVGVNPVATTATPVMTDERANELLQRMSSTTRKRYLQNANDILRNRGRTKKNAAAKIKARSNAEAQIAANNARANATRIRQENNNDLNRSQGLATDRERGKAEVTAFEEKVRANNAAAKAAAYVKSREEHYAAQAKNISRGQSVDDEEDTEALRAAATLLEQTMPANVKSQSGDEQNAWLAIELDKALESGYFERNRRLSIPIRKYLKSYKPSLMGKTKKQRGFAAWRGVRALKTPANVAAPAVPLTDEEELAEAERQLAQEEKAAADAKKLLVNAEREGNTARSPVNSWSDSRREAAKLEYNAWEPGKTKLSNNANRYGRWERSANFKNIDNAGKLKNISDLEAEIQDLITKRNAQTKRSNHDKLDEEVNKKTAKLESLKRGQLEPLKMEQDIKNKKEALEKAEEEYIKAQRNKNVDRLNALKDEVNAARASLQELEGPENDSALYTNDPAFRNLATMEELEALRNAPAANDPPGSAAAYRKAEAAARAAAAAERSAARRAAAPASRGANTYTPYVPGSSPFGLFSLLGGSLRRKRKNSSKRRHTKRK
jgi:hypothetical protein